MQVLKTSNHAQPMSKPRQRVNPWLHRWRALTAVVGREIFKFMRQPTRLASALVRPLLWFVVFAAGFHNVFGIAIIPPYETYIEYKVYMVPGLLGMIALFNGMQSSLSLVYDREMGVMRHLLTAPLARGWLLLFKLVAGASLSLLQMVVFIGIAWLFGVYFTWGHILLALPVMALACVLLAAVGLLLSVYVRQMENFAGAMNFVIFPMFFISPALYPLWKLEESGSYWLHLLAQFNPFTYVVEAIRFALYGQLHSLGIATMVCGTLLCYSIALGGYDPQRGWAKHH
tara:strand:- start:1167 stop:2024 length:858 start_codon:yes stop_codon:yes gene_type:complete